MFTALLTILVGAFIGVNYTYDNKFDYCEKIENKTKHEKKLCKDYFIKKK